MSTDEYVPSEEDAVDYYVLGRGRSTPGLSLTELRDAYAPEFDLFIEASRRDAARDALDGLYADAAQDYHLGVQGGDQERIDAAEAVLRAVYAWTDNYPEETTL